MYQANPEALRDDRFSPGELGWLVAAITAGSWMRGARRCGLPRQICTAASSRSKSPLSRTREPGDWCRWKKSPASSSPLRACASAPVIARLTPSHASTSRWRSLRSRKPAVTASRRSRPNGHARETGQPLTAHRTALIPHHSSIPGELATSYVSNPWSGDLIRARVITFARLGLSSYRGKAIRDEASLAGKWAENRRAEHIIIRAAFTQALWQRADRPGLMVYWRIRLSARQELKSRLIPLTSATFSRAIAESHFNSERADTAALLRRRLPVERLYMTFLETPAMNKQFLEAEACYSAVTTRCSPDCACHIHVTPRAAAVTGCN
jgi:hypothetical protein